MYNCVPCKYKTTNKYHFAKHTKTQKHARNTNKQEHIVHPKKKCKYCDKYFDHRSIDRHTVSCKSKEIHNTIKGINDQHEERLEKIIKELEEVKMINKEYAKINKEYVKLITEYNKRPHIVINSENNIKNNTININHTSNIGGILQQYNNVPNIEDIASTPLTDYEKEIIDSSGVVNGAIEYLINRCVSDIDPEKRPFHCTDPARNMYITKHTDKWFKDPKGQLIEKHMKHPIIIYACESILTVPDLKKQYQIIEEISDIRENYGRKVLNPNKGKVLSKNMLFIDPINGVDGINGINSIDDVV